MLDGGIAVGSIVGGSALLRVFRESKAKFGLDSTSAIKKQQAAIKQAWNDKTKGNWLEEADLNAADERLAALLPDCIPDASQLGGTIVNTKPYPDHAAELILANLAEKAEIFRPEGEMGHSPAARTFAETVIKASLRAALNNPEYARHLFPHMLIDIGAGVARIEEKVSNLADYLVTQNQQLAADLGVSNDRLIRLAKRVASKVSDPASAEDYLYGALERLKQLEAEGKRGTNFGGLIDQVIAEIFTAIDDEDIAGARTKGAAAFEQFKVQQQELAAATEKVVRTNIKTALLDLDVDGALHWVLQKLALQSGGAPPLDDLGSEMISWYELALNRGLRLEMDLAIAVARHNLDTAINPEERAMIQNDLGNALVQQGSRSSGEEGLKLLQDAVQAYQGALEIHTKDDIPANWAMTQNNLGNALQEQGIRSSGEKGLKLLQDAVKAYRAALEVYTKKDMPADWAMTQNNLGNALLEQGSRSGGNEGLILLQDAVQAYRAALEIRTKEDMPVNWAMTQNNLGNALQEQGSRSSGEECLILLQDAVKAYRAALEVYTKKDMPADWAMTQNNLGIALAEQGERSSGKEGLILLQDAVNAYHAALEIRTKDAMPADWAMTQNNLGIAYVGIADLQDIATDKIASLEQAAKHFRAALTVFDPVNMPHYYDKASTALQAVEDEISALRGGGDASGVTA